VARQRLARISNLLAAVGRFLTRTLPGRILVFLSLPTAIIAIALWEQDHSPPIFDMQMHYNEEAWEGFSARGILKSLQRKNVRWAAVSSTPNEGTAKLYRLDGARIIPFLVPYRTREDRDHWVEKPETIEWVQTELALGTYRGIGEFHLYDGRMDTPVVRRLVALAVERNLVLNVHAEADVMARFLTFDPGMRVVWAHAGLKTSLRRIGELLERHRRLHVELSHRADIAPNGQLAAEWRELFERYPDRFMVGSGTYNNEFWYRYGHTLELNREWLRQLPPKLGERIAFQNALDLLTRP